MDTSKIKVFISERTNLFEPIIEDEFDMVDNYDDADIVIAQSTVNTSWDLSKVIYLSIEPPLASHRVWCYSNADNFHTFMTHDPKQDKNNQFPFTKNDEAQFYPTRADPYPFVTREDTTIGDRGVFYAGMVGFYENAPDSHGGVNITPLRRTLGKYFIKEFPKSMIIGNGWKNQTVKVDNWREDKISQIKDSNCDFVLALENTIYPNYIYEKIWDGISNDMVTLYLGDPNVQNHIPLDCFIDLRPYVDMENKDIDIDAIGKRIREITQEEYDLILDNARKFRLTSKGKHLELMKDISRFLVRRINYNATEFR